MKQVVVIPTYWTNEAATPTDQLFNIYDHPTPLNQEDTLTRTLESLRSLEGDFQVLIIGTITEPELAEELEKRVKGILAKFNDPPPLFFGPAALKVLHRRLEELGLESLIPHISLEGYSNIRNLCLIIPQILGAEVAVLLDDDEVVTERDYLQRATEFLGTAFDGETVWAKTGYYKDKNGVTFGSDKVAWWDFFWRKGRAMNESLRKLLAEPRLKKTALGLGGIMVVHRHLFEKVAFDPYALRGEDCDYVINARLHGYSFFGDNQVYIVHLPPPRFEHVLGLRQDIYRFIYEQRKLAYAAHRSDLKPVSPAELDPYPGQLLRRNIVWKCLSVALGTALRDVFTRDFIRRLRLIKTVFLEAPRFAREHEGEYFEFQRRWPEMMEKIRGDEKLIQTLFGS